MVPKDSIPDAVEEEIESKPAGITYSLEILRIIKDAQQQHGLRHGDYQRYRGYCSRRIRRLRKVLKIPQGDRRHYKRRDVTEAHLSLVKSDERFLHVPLVLAERAWALAMQLRQESNTEPRKKFHLTQRLRKACAYSLQLEELCKAEKCDARSKLEAQAYVAWMHGTLHFELQLWPEATENLKKAQVVYETIASTLPEDEQLIYKQRVEELAPSLRYCAYNIGDEKTVNLLELRGQGLIENLDSLILQAKEKRFEDIMEVQWFGVKVIVRSEKIKLFLVSIKDLDETLNRAENTQARIGLIEQMLIDCRDAVNIAREEVRLGTLGAPLLLSYLLYTRMYRTVQRNENLIQQSKKTQEIGRLYEIILQQLYDMKQLSGMDDNKVFLKEVDALISKFKAFKSFNLGKQFATVRRWRESIMCHQKCSKLIQVILKSKPSAELKDQLLKLQSDIETEMITAQAQCVLEDTTEEPSLAANKKSKKPLIERLDEYREDPQLLTQNPNVVPLPPAMQPVPCKPFFFDLAYNFVKFPDLSDKVEQQNKQPKTSAGVSGFVKGLFGWGGNK